MASCVFEILRSDELFGNPGSLHSLGIKAKKAQIEALRGICGVLGCTQEEFIFTSGGTESINMSLRGYLQANPRSGKHIISTKTEHKAVLEMLAYLSTTGYEVTYIPVDSHGRPDLNILISSIREDTSLITFTHVNSETGAVLPVAEVVAAKNKVNPKVKIHLDCVQSLGKLPLDFRVLGVDMASFSAHKIHGVKGVGGIYIRKGCKVSALLLGGGQQNGMRSGTESPWLFTSFSLAVKRAEERRESAYQNSKKLKKLLIEGVSSYLDAVHSPQDGLPYIVNLSFSGFASETLLHALETFDIYVSTVSACASRKQKISHVLTEMGIPKEIASRAIRISFSSFSSEEEITIFCGAIRQIYEKYSLQRG